MDCNTAENTDRFFTALARELKSLAHSNVQYFENGKQSHHAKFHVTFKLLYEYLDMGIEPSYREISKHLHLYDFSPSVKGNGYRSLLKIVQKCCIHLLQISRHILAVRDSRLFRKKFYIQELESYVTVLGQLRAVLYYALKLVHYCQNGDLFADETQINPEVAEALLEEVESLSQECFYGRCLGFQFCPSMSRPMNLLTIAMASYSEGYLESSQMMQVASSIFNSGKYFLDPDARAQQVVKVTRTADIQFCKAFWGFSEHSLMHQLPSLVCPSVEVNELITLGPDAFELPSIDGADGVVITPPCAHTGPGHVRVRLISAYMLEGQEVFKKETKSKSSSPTKVRTPGLLVHIHGGGFVAQSSKSHEVYLRHWAVSLGVPILSIDYSLSPELPFPRALEECFYAYAWAVKECLQLGSTGERIVFAGDSAGGNLVISVAMRAASYGIRPPDGIVAVYPCTLVKYTPSPARLISLLDPILPVGLISRCLAAYAGINEKHPLSSTAPEDIHSENSLAAMKISSYETPNKDDWIIVAEDEDEANAIRDRRTPQSPSSPKSRCPKKTKSSNSVENSQSPNGKTSKIQTAPSLKSSSQNPQTSSSSNLPRLPPGVDQSVIDSLEDSYHAKLTRTRATLIDSSQHEEFTLEKSASAEYEELEIFNRLQTNGICELRSTGDSVPTSLCEGEYGLNPEFGLELHNTSTPETSSLSNLSMLTIQEKAKNMVEGAHTMWSNISSYIPSSSSGSLAASRSRYVFVDVDQASDSVDLIPLQDMKSENSDGHNITEVEDSEKQTNGDFLSTLVFHNGSLVEEVKIGDGKVNSSVENLEIVNRNLTEVCGNTPKASKTIMEIGENIQIVSDSELGDKNVLCVEKIDYKPSEDNLLLQSDNIITVNPNLLSENVEPLCSNSESKFKEVNLLSETEDIYNTGHSSNSNRNVDSDETNVFYQSHLLSENNQSVFYQSHLLRENNQSPECANNKQEHSLSSSLTSSQSFTTPLTTPLSDNNPLSTPLMEDNIITATLSKQGQVMDPGSPSSSPSCCATSPQQHLFLDSEKPLIGVSPSTLKNPHVPIDSNISVDSEVQNSAAAEDITRLDREHNKLVDERDSEIIKESNVQNHDIDEEEEHASIAYGQSESFDTDNRTPTSIVKPTSLRLRSTTSPDIPSATKSSYKNPRNSILHDAVVKQIHDAISDVDVIQSESLSESDQDQDPSAFTTMAAPGSSSEAPISTHTQLSPDLPSPHFYGTDLREPFQGVDQDICFDSSRFEIGAEFFSPPNNGDMPGDTALQHSESAPALSGMLSPDQSSPPVHHHGPKTGMSPCDFKRQTFSVSSPLHVLRRAPVVENPYMSPLLASDELIRGLPRMCIVGCHLDPLLDDSVMFARRLQKLEMPVDLFLVDDLPHGFLNFALLSSEAKAASDLCCKRIAEMLSKPE